ncbi:mu-type opioid receptor [Arapaima gigas]
MSAWWQDPPGAEWVKLLPVALCVVVCVIGLPCNCVVLTAQLQLRYVSDVLLRSLALSDCLLLLAMLVPLPHLLLPPRMLGHTVCGAHLALGYLAHLSGGLTLAALSLFRCLLLRGGWAHRGRPRLGWALCSLIWSLSLLLAAPAAFLARALPPPAFRPQSDHDSELSTAAVSAPVTVTTATEPSSHPPPADMSHLRSVWEPQSLAGFTPEPPVDSELVPVLLSPTLSLPACALLFPASSWPWANLWRWAALSAAYLLPLVTMLACCCPLLVRLCSAGLRLPQRRGAAATAARRVVGSVATFSVCWTPLHLLVFFDPQLSHALNAVRRLLLVLGVCSAAVNPVLYAQLDGRGHRHGDHHPAETPHEQESVV